MDKHQPHLTDGYGQLLQRLRKDLQLDATTDLLPGSIAAAVANDTTSHRLTWTAPTLINLWANTAGATPAGYLKDPLGFVHLRGRIGGGANGTVIFTLPAGFRPATSANADLYPISGNNGGSALAAFVQIVSNGNILLFTTGGAFTDIGLGGVTFLAEN